MLVILLVPCFAGHYRETPRAVVRVPLNGGPVPVLHILDTKAVPPARQWHPIPLPLGTALWALGEFWGHGSGRFKHAVPAPAFGQGPRLPSAVLLRTAA